MKIAVLGAGSLGCVFGGHLAEAGHDVTLLNRNANVVQAILADGLVMREAGISRSVRLGAATSAAGLGVVDLIIVLVKSGDTETALAGATHLIGENTRLLSLQNGVGHEEILARFAPATQVLIGKTYIGGVMVAPGVIEAGTHGKTTQIGQPDAGSSAELHSLATRFTQAGLHCEARSDILTVIWDKLLVNVATGALSGITGLAYGALYDVPEVADCARAAVREAMDVAAAAGIALTFTSPDGPWKRAAEGLLPSFKASMLQSLEKGALTEIDFINGAVVRAGRSHGVPTPVNAALVAAIKGIERRILDNRSKPA